MLYPSIPELIKKKDRQCRYSLVIAVAKRARTIAAEIEARGERLEERAVSLAVKSFASGEANFEENRNVK